MNLLGLAFRNVLRQKRRTALTLTAVLAGVAVSTVLSGFRNAFVTLLVEDAVRGQVGAFQVHAAGYAREKEALPLDRSLPEGGAFQRGLRAVPGVRAVAPRIRFAGIVSGGTTSAMFVAVAVDPELEYEVCPLLRRRAVAADGGPGTPVSPGIADGIVMGRELADGLGVALGGTVTLTARTAAGGMNALEATVIAYTLPANPFEGKRVVYTPLAFAQRLLGMDGRVTEYAADVSDLTAVAASADLARRAPGAPVEVSTWEVLSPLAREVSVRMAVAIGIVSAVLLVIVVAGVLNTMLMSVYERVREIGTLLALGMRRRAVLSLFVLEALVLCLAGGAAGAAVGAAAVAAMYALGIPVTPPGGGLPATLHPFVDPAYVAVAVAVALAGGLLASAYPAFRASRMDPVEALRAL